MFHWTPEGASQKVGFNFYLCCRYLKISFVWVDLPNRTATSQRFRLSWYPFRWFHQKKAKWDMLEPYLRVRGFCIITEEQYEDFVKGQGEGISSIVHPQEIYESMLKMKIGETK